MAVMSFAVIIPVHNRETLLPFAISRVLAQAPAPDEVIVIDDGSTDRSAQVAEAAGSGVRCIRIENSGHIAARNVALRETTADLVAFCDSDDLWEPGFIAAAIALWKAEPNTNVAYCDFRTFRDNHWSSKTKFAAAPTMFWKGLRSVSSDAGVFEFSIVDRLLTYQPLFPSCMVARRDFLASVGGWDESIGRTVGADFATALLVAEHPPIGIIRRPLVGIRKHAGNRSGDVQAMNLGDAFVLETALATRPSLAPLAPAIRASIRQRRLDAFDTAFARMDFAGAIEIAKTLGNMHGKARLKASILALPEPLRRIAASAALRQADARGGAAYLPAVRGRRPWWAETLKVG